MTKKSGFTIIEMVIVIALLGIIATIVGPRFASVSTYSNRANKDKVQFLLKLGQKTAVSQRRAIYVRTDSNNLLLCYTNASPCPANQTLTVNSKNYVVGLTGTTITIPNFSFNANGGTGVAKITIPIGTKNIYVESESGLVHE